MMARSRALNKIRSRKTQQRALEKLKTHPTQPEPTPLEQASSLEKEENLQRALAQLPEKYRRILEMNYYQGLSHSQIAESLQMPLGTVKTNARKGLVLLRQLLGVQVT